MSPPAPPPEARAGGPLALGPLALGIDLGSSGVRVALVAVPMPGDGPASQAEALVQLDSPYAGEFEDPLGWLGALIALVGRLPARLRSRVGALALDGTSGTLLLCRRDGSLPAGTLARALPYHQACPERAAAAARILAPLDPASACGPAAGASGSLARALELLAQAEAQGAGPDLLLRHQADWLMGWLMGNWSWGEEGNNLRLGWNPATARWEGALAAQPWAPALPRIVASGGVVGSLGAEAAERLGLPARCRVVAGSTDANAGVLAAGPGEGEGITVLGTTLVVKQFVAAPIVAPGVSCHRVAGRWLAGGASNTGAGILRRFFSDERIAELSGQIDPEHPSGLALLPLPRRGERFPVDDPLLEPVLEPRPTSDALYLQALLEGLTAIEAAGWRRLQELGAPPIRRVITLGGGARNPQWRRIRQRALGIPVLNRTSLTAALGMARLAGSRMGACEPPTP